MFLVKRIIGMPITVKIWLKLLKLFTEHCGFVFSGHCVDWGLSLTPKFPNRGNNDYEVLKCKDFQDPALPSNWKTFNALLGSQGLSRSRKIETFLQELWRTSGHPCQQHKEHSTNLLLAELESSLVFGDLQQLHRSLLVRGEAADLPDQITHKLCVFCQSLYRQQCMQCDFRLNLL